MNYDNESVRSCQEKVENILLPWTVEARKADITRLDVVVRPDDLHAAVKALIDAKWGYLSAITGLDHPAPAPAEGQPAAEGALELLYHFCEGAVMATLRITLPYSHPVILSICDILPVAVLYEREIIELFGVDIVDIPNKEHLLLPDDWPDGVYPLRKSFTGTSPHLENGNVVFTEKGAH